MKLLSLLLITAFAGSHYPDQGKPWDQAVEELRQSLTNEKHVVSVKRDRCDSNTGAPADSFTVIRVQCLLIETDDDATTARLQAIYPLGSMFEDFYVNVMTQLAPWPTVP